MRAKEIRDRSDDELLSLERQLEETYFQSRLKNATNQLANTSLLQKTRRDLARVKTVLRDRGLH